MGVPKKYINGGLNFGLTSSQQDERKCICGKRIRIEKKENKRRYIEAILSSTSLSWKMLAGKIKVNVI